MKRTALTSLLFLTLTMSVAPASAHEFLASSTGKLTVKLLTASKFTTQAGIIECKGATLGEGEVKTLKSLFLLSTVQFENCKAFGLAAKISSLKIRSTAEGSVSLLRSGTVTTTGCEVRIPSAKNQNLNSVKYKNTNKGIEKVATVSGITSSGLGAACTYAEESQGTFQGDAIVNLIGGTLDWK